MRELPILFTTESVRAILEGRKTQTRRTNGLEYINISPDDWRIIGESNTPEIYAVCFMNNSSGENIWLYPRYQA